jgi:ubiquinone/menaquinone biosynthesis C-methylase UbiE
MKRSREEQAQTKRFDELYVRAQSPVMLSVERSVCGCNYGSSSWTTRAEAEQIVALLRLRPGMRLLDVGAGSGWPGLYMAKTSGCDVVLTDLPFAGLRIAAERADIDCFPGTCWIVAADAAMLPFPGGSFDAVSHSDLLCCLRQKRAVLETCHRVIREDGRMVFTVISISPDLSPREYECAVANGPEFVQSEASYPTLLRQTGWIIVDRQDLTLDYAASFRRLLQAHQKRKHALEALIGAAELAERHADCRSELTAIDNGLLRRELFVAIPDGA